MTLTHVVRRENLRNGRNEIWEAREGIFQFERLEVEGTPWDVTAPTMCGLEWHMLAGSLKRARESAPRQFAFDFLLAWLHCMGLEPRRSEAKMKFTVV